MKYSDQVHFCSWTTLSLKALQISIVSHFYDCTFSTLSSWLSVSEVHSEHYKTAAKATSQGPQSYHSGDVVICTAAVVMAYLLGVPGVHRAVHHNITSDLDASSQFSACSFLLCFKEDREWKHTKKACDSLININKRQLFCRTTDTQSYDFYLLIIVLRSRSQSFHQGQCREVQNKRLVKYNVWTKGLLKRRVGGPRFVKRS